jgi:hypothetical protein
MATWTCHNDSSNVPQAHKANRGPSSAPHSLIWSQQPVHKRATSNQHVHNHHTTNFNNTLATPQQWLCFDLWRLCNIFIALIAVWDAPLGFFSLFCETHNNVFQQLKRIT